jgi:hypothetical protein
MSRARASVARLKIAALALAVIGALTVLPSAASADPGTCAVRSQGPSVVGAGIFGYTVRNRCKVSTIKVRVKFPLYNRTTSCKTIGATGYASWTSIYLDENWVVQTCA